MKRHLQHFITERLQNNQCRLHSFALFNLQEGKGVGGEDKKEHNKLLSYSHKKRSLSIILPPLPLIHAHTRNKLQSNILLQNASASNHHRIQQQGRWIYSTYFIHRK